MIPRDKMDGIGMADAAMVSIAKRRDFLKKHIAQLETSLKEGHAQLDRSQDDLTNATVGFVYTMQCCKEELRRFREEHVDGLHRTILDVVQTFNDQTKGAMPYNDLKAAVTDQVGILSVEMGMGIVAAVQELLDTHLLIRGDGEHDVALRGKYWTAEVDVTAGIAEVGASLKGVQLHVGHTKLPDNVRPLWKQQEET